MPQSYTLIPDLYSLPAAMGRSTSVQHQDDRSKVVILDFPAGEGLPVHNTQAPVMIQILDGEASLQLGDDTVTAQRGAFIYLTPGLPHSILAITKLRFLLIRLL